ncbi:spore coat protein A [Geobacter sp. OR-1]|uniref:multicopper oxidase family protein n=1 Tax=Geobacter sp. OR-1 TaxID=1266765 RepID=UPI0005436AC7|nr:multicopper oxidase domain-containing protein [Geobacter sp. OR-1]GAM07871.1 spore coat protein A [Geobacter sp. OR-1]
MSTRFSRRRFLQISGLAAGASMLPMPVKWLGSGNAMAFYQSSGIPLFKTPFRITEIPISAPDLTKAPVTGVTHYTISIQEFQDQIIPTGYGYDKTTFWGYDPANTVQEALGLAKPPATHLGGIILANRGEPVQITFRNKLDKTYNGQPLTKHIIPNDITIGGASLGVNRTCTHLHGGYIPWISDGGPFDWWKPDGTHGLSFRNNETLNPGAAAGEAEFYYGNNQSARFIWYHDHAYGVTRIHAYAGIASAYFIRDNFEANLIANAGLPPYVESSAKAGTEIQEIPLVFQDKIFVGKNINLLDPSWKNIVSPSAQGPGSLWYPHLYESNRWRKTYSTKPLPNPSIVAEMFGDTMLVNGTVYPEIQVQPRRYRLRMLNACNARFLNLQLYLDDGSPDGITLNAAGIPTNAPFLNAALKDALNPNGKPAVLQIATEGGFLSQAAEVPMNVPFSLNSAINLLNPVGQGSLIVGCAERHDLIVDFSAAAGQKVVLYNDAPAPFPGGDPRNDYFPGLANGNPVNSKTAKGFGPNTRVLMRFNVSKPLSLPADSPLAITNGTKFETMPAVGGHTWNDPLVVPNNAAGVPDLTLLPALTNPDGSPIKIRRLSLNENFDAWGRLQQQVGTDALQPNGGYGQAYENQATEVINLNGKPSVREIWQIANLTADVHPMHFHLVNVQILKRQPVNVLTPFATLLNTGNYFTDNFDRFNFTGEPARAPDPNESGWKETCRMNPGEVITVIMEISLPAITKADGSVVPTPPSLRTGDHEYAWHCHILEHEEHDMMRPLVVKA